MMESKCVSIRLLPGLFMVLLLLGLAKADLAKDREQCANQLIGLATCLPYVGGDAKVPTMDCCSGLKLVLQKSKICLCILVKDRDDPNLGIKVNVTRALGLPDACHVPGANIGECPALLNLPPNSPDAKVFEDFAKSSKNSTSISTTAPPGNASGKAGSSSAEINNDGGRGQNLLGVEKALGLLLIVGLLLSHLT